MLENYNINDYLKDDKELQKAVIQELLDDFQCAVMNVENLLETKQRLKAELTDLKAENERLKEEIKEVKKYQYQQEFLEKEIEEQREKNKRLTCKILEVKALNETLNVQCTSQDCTQLRKLYQTLQEIKKILLQAMDVKSNAYNHFLKVEQAIDLITKAESEG